MTEPKEEIEDICGCIPEPHEDKNLELTIRQIMAITRERLASDTTLPNASIYMTTLRGIKPYINHDMTDPNSTYNLYLRDYLELMKRVKEPVPKGQTRRWGII